MDEHEWIFDVEPRVRQLLDDLISRYSDKIDTLETMIYTLSSRITCLESHIEFLIGEDNDY
jgi:hypothetical protein